MLRFLWNIAGRPLILVLALGCLWLVLSGYYTSPTLLAFGVLSVLIATWLAQRAGMMDGEGVPTHIFPGLLSYMLWLTVEIGKSNFIVTMHALSPTMKLSPKMVTVPARQSSDLGKVIFANSITLTPGTVSIDLHENEILVHALTESLADIDGMADMGEKVCRFDGRVGQDRARKRREEEAKQEEARQKGAASGREGSPS